MNFEKKTLFRRTQFLCLSQFVTCDAISARKSRFTALSLPCHVSLNFTATGFVYFGSIRADFAPARTGCFQDHNANKPIDARELEQIQRQRFYEDLWFVI